MEQKVNLKHRPTMLVVLDGWGIAIPSQANAITLAKTPNIDRWVSQYPVFSLQASGEATGLPWSEVGNSEVGHMSIGAGRIVYQELSRINNAISTRSFFSNETFHKQVEHVKKNKGTLHLIGMASSGGVHSHVEHLYALLELAQEQGASSVAVHAILDGRDTPYASGKEQIEKLLTRVNALPGCSIASLSGRFYAMDRDNHWDRIEKAYRAIVEGTSDETADDPVRAIEKSYEKGVYDEQFVPIVLTKKGKPIAPFKKGDAVIFYNIRADRARQLVASMVRADFDKFKRTDVLDCSFATFTEYEKALPVAVAFPPQAVTNCLAEIISKAGLSQLHVAETEKYAHITYFLNDGREEPFEGEKRTMLPSPSVASYDDQPEMSAQDIARTLAKAIETEEYDFIAANFANADMVGHTGNLKATIKAIETIDQCLGMIVPLVLAKNGAVVITADHGNAESLVDLKTGTIDKEHSNNPVPCIVLAADLEGRSLGVVDVDVFGKDLSILEQSGILSDVAPTILDLLGVEKPVEMTGNSLLSNI